MDFIVCGGIFVCENGGIIEVKNLSRAVFAFVIGVVAFVGAGCSTGTEGPSGQVSGALTPEQRFTLKNLRGEDIRLDGVLAANKAVLVDFWATWCGYCVEEMPDLIRLQQKYDRRPFTVLAVNAGESAHQVSLFNEKMKLNFPVLLDEEMITLQKFGINGIPTSLLLDSQGKVLGVYHQYSSRLEQDVENALKEDSS